MERESVCGGCVCVCVWGGGEMHVLEILRNAMNSKWKKVDKPRKETTREEVRSVSVCYSTEFK